MVLPDAFQDVLATGVDERLKSFGYEWRDVAYDDRRPGEVVSGPSPYMRILSRLAIVSAEETRWADFRNMLAITVVDPETDSEIEVVGVHLSDRASRYRRQQAEDAIPFLNRDKRPRVALGDWNEIHATDVRGRLFGNSLMRYIARSIPSQHELSDERIYGDLRGYAMRSTDMASGEALARIEQATDLRELDPRHRATATPKIRGIEWLPSVRLLQLDHVYASSHIEAGLIRIGSDGGSDHRDISTTLVIKK